LKVRGDLAPDDLSRPRFDTVWRCHAIALGRSPRKLEVPPNEVTSERRMELIDVEFRDAIRKTDHFTP